MSEPFAVRATAGGPQVWWVKVQCDCAAGTIKDIRASEFGRTVSCGCRKGRRGPREIKNKTEPGQIFGRLTVLEVIRVNGRRLARCQCSCGTVKDVPPGHLVAGNVKSCGCYNRDVARERMNSRVAPSGADHPGFKHGLALKTTRHPHYNRWESMMNRCQNPNDSSYHNYGAIGIKVHEPWRNVAVFVAELDALLGPCPEGHSLDRIDVFGHYEPGNLRWATSQEQASNRRNSRIDAVGMAVRLIAAIRRVHPGHSQQWYVTFAERAALKAVRVPVRALPPLPQV